MQALDSTIANVALPYMQGSLSASYDQITWVLTSYVVAAAIMTAPVGWLAARFGQKNLYLVSIVGFTIASMACGIATSLYEMVLDRLIQGMFGAALVPLSQGTMLNIYPPESRGSAMAIWGMGVMVGPILGPTLGGYLTDFYNWRYVFFVNLPFGIAATLGLWFFLPAEKPRSGLRFDWFGFASLALGVSGLQLMLDRGEIKDWFGSTEIIIEALIAGVGFYLFLVQMVTGKRPFITPAIFRDRNFVFGLVIMFAIGMVLLASSALLAPWLQELGNYPVNTAGLLLAPRGIGTMLAMMIVGRITNRVDPRLLMGVGVVLLWWSMTRLSDWTPAVSDWSLGDQHDRAGCRHRPDLRPAQRGGVRDAAGAVALRGHRADQPAPQHRQRDRHLDLRGTADQQHPGGAFGARAIRFAAEPGAAGRARAVAATPHGAAVMDQMINYQAQVIAYNNDYWLMGLLALPLLLLLPFMARPQGDRGGAGGHAAAAD